jgi:hypothetical protein
MEHTKTLCGQNTESECVRAGGKYSNHWALSTTTAVQHRMRHDKMILEDEFGRVQREVSGGQYSCNISKFVGQNEKCHETHQDRLCHVLYKRRAKAGPRVIFCSQLHENCRENS